jgi:hypothetical protein
MAPPPGGPPITTPLVLLAALPDTAPNTAQSLPNFRGSAAFVFDRIVNEGSQPNFGNSAGGLGLGTGDLEKLVLLSPDTTVPHVQWARSRILVRPRNGWRPNTVYRIELLPGLTDLHNNTLKKTSVITFATGGPLPTAWLRGRVIDWASRHGLAGALITATEVDNGNAYRTYADSTGRFALGPLPTSDYLVVALDDKSHNRRLDAPEAWDSTRVRSGRDSVGEIWAFARDTAAPKIQAIERVDSQTIGITMSLPVDPAWRVPADSIRVLLLPDSLNVNPGVAMPGAVYDSLHKPIPKAADTTGRGAGRGAAASGRAAAPPVTSRRGPPPPKPDPPLEKRPALGTRVVVQTRGRLNIGSNYFVQVHGVRMANGVTGTVTRVLALPRPSPADSAKAHADSVAKAKVDSIAKAKGDSTHPPTKPDSGHRARR